MFHTTGNRENDTRKLIAVCTTAANRSTSPMDQMYRGPLAMAHRACTASSWELIMKFQVSTLHPACHMRIKHLGACSTALLEPLLDWAGYPGRVFSLKPEYLAHSTARRHTSTNLPSCSMRCTSCVLLDCPRQVLHATPSDNLDVLALDVRIRSFPRRDPRGWSELGSETQQLGILHIRED